MSQCVWPMDVLHVSPLGEYSLCMFLLLAFLMLFMSCLLMGHQHAIAHCLAALAVMGHPQHLKMGSAPAYDFSALQNCCAQNTDIPYNPQKQANGERSHR